MLKYFVLALAFAVLIFANFAKSATHKVEINQKMQFVPQTLTIKSGDTVIWTNKSSMLHNVVSLPIKMRSKMLKKGETFQFTFKDVGEVKYYCEPHKAHMKGTINVK